MGRVVGARGRPLPGGAAGALMALVLGATTASRPPIRTYLASLRRRRWTATVAVTVVGLAALAPVGLSRFVQGREGLRVDLWRAALATFLQHPLLGGGPGTWVQLKVTENPVGSANV